MPILPLSFFFNAAATSQNYTLSLHDALPISAGGAGRAEPPLPAREPQPSVQMRSEEHTSELQSRFDLVCRLLLEKKKASFSDDTSRRKRLPRKQPALRHSGSDSAPAGVPSHQ